MSKLLIPLLLFTTSCSFDLNTDKLFERHDELLKRHARILKRLKREHRRCLNVFNILYVYTNEDKLSYNDTFKILKESECL